jgi:hypothetical protein
MNSFEDEDGVTVYLDMVPDCGICGIEMRRWSHHNPYILVCLTCDRGTR